VPTHRTAPTLAAATALGLLAALAPASGAAAASSAPAVASSSAHRVPAADTEVRFTVEGTVTYGTLHVPAHRRGQRLPAALLLPGSGPTDRNGDQPPALTPHTLALLADALGRDGVMTLRFDKYGTGRTGLGAYAKHPETITYPAFVRQAAAAYALLGRQHAADRHRLFVVGHSEGALTALALAREVHPRPAGLALLQPQAKRLLDVVALQLHAQVAAAVTAGSLPAAQQHALDAAIDRAIADIRAARPVDVTGLPPALAQLFRSLQGVNARFVATDDAIDPGDLGRRVPRGTRVLLTCGTVDPQVPCATTDRLTTALRRAGTRGPGRVVLPGVGHLLTTADHPDRLAPSLLRALHRLVAGGASSGRAQ
jgi:uncharacterized protein